MKRIQNKNKKQSSWYRTINNQSLFERWKWGGRGQGNSRSSSGKDKSFFYQQRIHLFNPPITIPASPPIIKHCAALRTHAPCLPSHFLWKHALVLHRIEICKQESWVALHIHWRYAFKSHVQWRTKHGNWVALGHKECHGFVSPTALVAVVNFVFTSPLMSKE